MLSTLSTCYFPFFFSVYRESIEGTWKKKFEYCDAMLLVLLLYNAHGCKQSEFYVPIFFKINHFYIEYFETDISNSLINNQ